MISLTRKTSQTPSENPNPQNLLTQLRVPLKWQDEAEPLKYSRDPETDFSSTNSHSRIEDRSMSPLEKQKGGFSALAQALNSKCLFGPNQSGNHPNPKYKTELCKNYDVYGYCKWADNCFFAHGKNELKSKTLINHFYKTKICKHYHRVGFCPYSSRCQYFHFKTYQIYQELLDSFESKLNHRINENDQKLDKMLAKFERTQPRLGVFKGLARGDDQKSLQERFIDNEF